MWDLNRKVMLMQQDHEITMKLQHADDARTYVTVWNHRDDDYDGNFYRDGFWNGQPHFVNANGRHLYYYNALDYFTGGYW